VNTVYICVQTAVDEEGQEACPSNQGKNGAAKPGQVSTTSLDDVVGLSVTVVA